MPQDFPGNITPLFINLLFFLNIFICHNLALVQMFCDRVLVLYEGRVVESGIPDDIINEPKEEYTQRLVDAVLS